MGDTLQDVNPSGGIDSSFGIPGKETRIEETEQASSKQDSSTGDDLDEPNPHLHAKTFLAIFSICLTYFAQNFCIIGAGSQSNIIAAIFDDAGAASWCTAVLAIFTVILGPIISQAADYWGRKWFSVICNFFGGVGALIVARSTSMNMVIAGFCVTGIAFGQQPLLHAIAGEVLPRKWRSWGQGILVMSTGLGLLLSLIAGGVLNRHGNPDGFRTFSYIVMALFFSSSITCLVAYRPLPLPLQSELSFNQKIGRLDWVGFGLLASSLVLFCLGLSWSQNPYPWSDPHVSAPFAIGVALAIVLVLYETKFKADGMFHHGLFTKNRNFSISLFCIFCEGIAFFAANVYFSYELSVLYESDTLIVAIRFGITFITAIIASGLTSLFTTATKQVRLPTMVAFIIFIVFFACMATATPSTSTQVWGYPVFLGWSLGMTLTTLLTAAQLSIPPDLIAVASGIMISFRSLGGTIGISIYTAVLASALDNLGTNVAEAVVGAGLPESSVEQFVTALAAQNDTALALVPGVTPQIMGVGAEALLDTYATGFRNIWASAVGFVALAAIASYFLFDPKKEFNNHIDAPVEKDDELYSTKEVV